VVEGEEGVEASTLTLVDSEADDGYAGAVVRGKEGLALMERRLGKQSMHRHLGDAARFRNYPRDNRQSIRSIRWFISKIQ